MGLMSYVNFTLKEKLRFSRDLCSAIWTQNCFK